MRRRRFTSLLCATLFATACTDGPIRQQAGIASATDSAPRGLVDQPAPPEPAAPPRVAKPEQVKALYLNAWAAGSTKKLRKLIDIADKTEINAFVIDVKEAGEISYQSKVKLANDIGATREYIRNVSRLLDTLRAHNIYPIARIVVFKDPVLAEAKPELAVKTKEGSGLKGTGRCHRCSEPGVRQFG